MAEMGTPWGVSEQAVLDDIRRLLAGWGQVKGHPVPPPPVPVLLLVPGAPRFAMMVCGGCGRQFHATPETTPVLARWPCCLDCWEKRAHLRERTGLPWQERPPCYPEDFQPKG